MTRNLIPLANKKYAILKVNKERMCMVVCRGMVLGFGLLFGVIVADAPEQTSFIVKKQVVENTAKLSKDAIKERMGEAVRESMHSLFDNATCVVRVQKLNKQPLPATYTLHEKIIELQRKFSNIAESLIDKHSIYKKSNKKLLEASLVLLRTCETEFKETKEQLEAATVVTQAQVKEVTTKLAVLETKLSEDDCLKAV